MFLSNGLLASESAPTPTDTIESASEPIKFTLNGLLGSGTTALKSLNTLSQSQFSDTRSHEFEIDTPTEDAGSSSFGTSFFASKGSLLDSQEETLPPPEKAFGLPSHLLQPTFEAPGESSFSFDSFTSHNALRGTTYEGKTIYLKRKPKKLAQVRTAIPASAPSERMTHLLNVPIHRMMEELSIHKKLHDSEKGKNASHVSKDVDDTLWVDRYRPQRFTELVGNERVARDTLGWVKQWDWCVFGKNKVKKRMRDTEDENGWLADPNDPYHRPRERILLLSGPPGLGKTTMVHVIARHAGYEVMEINASDARTGQVVDDRIRPALEAGAMVGGTKPVLLVIDEVDGATGGGENASSFIHKLVQLATEKAAKKKKTKNGKSDGKRPILRPIICICNDQNASALAKLRPHTLQIRMQRPADVFVVKRLREVCEIEGMKAEARALSTLAGVARGDLRGCLNTLQFIKCKGQDVTESVMRRATAGMKEAEMSVLSVLNDLFVPLSKKRVLELGMTEDETKYVDRLSDAIDGSGRDISIAIGCFAHYATLRRHEATFRRYERANEWLGTYDLFSSAMYLEGDFSLNQYLPYTLVPFYPLFQERGSKVERSNADWEHQKVTQGNQEIYQSLSRGLRSASTRNVGAYRHFVSYPILQLEFAPYINRIIAPPLRPVGNRLIKGEDNILLNRLVAIMVALELRFVQERAEDGQLTYRLDPPIDVFVTYDGKRASDIALSRYAVRHLVAGEVDNLLKTHQTDIIEKGKRGKHDTLGKHRTDDDGDGLDGSKRRKVQDDFADKPPTDFFGRPIKLKSTSASTAPLSKGAPTVKTSSADTGQLQPSKPKFKVAFKYAEGNSAAVRKPVKVNAFL